MKTARFEVLSQGEIERIHAASMEILAEVGVKVDYKTARDIFRAAGAHADDEQQCVRLPEGLVSWALAQAPKQFDLYGIEPEFKLEVGGGQINFAGLGTPTHVIDTDTGQRRPATRQDMERHIILIDGCEHIHNSQMDVWPNDNPLATGC
jgi:trimethylamine--corrinoid protein Co-methyltransferase